MHTETQRRSTSYSSPWALGIVAIAVAILITGAIVGSSGAQDFATPVVDATPDVVANICDATAPGVGAEPWVRTELYFGTSIPDSDDVVSAEEWNAFLDEEITPRFPAGLTVLEGYGQFLNSQGVLVEEDSIVLILFYPGDAIDDSSAAIEEIRDAYETQFEQESVLRVDEEPVCVSF
jgi:hypothetical protein